MMMKKRRLGAVGPEVSAIGLGCMGMSVRMPGWTGSTDDCRQAPPCSLAPIQGEEAEMETIDITTWDRRDYFNLYAGTDLPYINIGAHLDITGLTRFSKKHGLSSYLTLIFSAHHIAEEMVNFRYRIKDGKPVLNHRMRPCFTYLPKGSDLFINVTVEPCADVMEFHEKAREQIAKQGNNLGVEIFRGRLDIINYSAIPWIQYTHFVRTIARCGVDSNPKISWGKYFNQEDRVLVPFSVQVHHALMDGYHVGKYFEELQRHIDQLGRE